MHCQEPESEEEISKACPFLELKTSVRSGSGQNIKSMQTSVATLGQFEPSSPLFEEVLQWTLKLRHKKYDIFIIYMD